MKVDIKVVRQYENVDDEERCVVKVFSSIPRPIWAGFHIQGFIFRQTIHIWNDSTTKEQGCKKKKNRIKQHKTARTYQVKQPC